MTSGFCNAISVRFFFDMPSVQVGIEGLDRLMGAMRDYPQISRPRLQDAVVASAAEVHRHATRENVPWRTGNLVQSFGQGIMIGELYASIGPNAKMAPYAIFVHEGTDRIKRPNKFMPRIADAAQPQVKEFFMKALENITRDIAKKV